MSGVSRIRAVWLAAGALALFAAGSVADAATASAAPAPGPATHTVVYLGHRFTVPVAWPVVDLTTHPRTCVRFDRPSVYLGTPGAASSCPSQVLGTSDALLLEPAAPGAAPAAASDDAVAHQITVTSAGIRAEATYASSPAEIDAVLASGGLSVPSAQASTAAPAAHAVRPAITVRPAVAAGATNFTGQGFDPCTAPSTAEMAAWKANSPYSAIGVYIGGVNRGCAQPNLTASWVSAEAANGWSFFPLYVGPQAAGACGGCVAITSPASQALAAAQDAAAQAASLGFAPGSLIVYDMEAYSSSQSSLVLPFISDWTDDLHALGYRSGEYSSLSSGITDLIDNIGNYTMPDVIDFADWNGQATTASSGIPASVWVNHQRIHQYSGGVDQTYGGITLNIDQDYLDVQLPPPAALEAGDLHVDTIVGGNVEDNIRYADGSWQGWGILGGPGGTITAITSTSMADGSMHVDVVANGTLWDNVRYLDGSWQGWATPGQPSGTITAVTAQGLPDGTMHLIVDADNVLWDDVRNADGSWSGWATAPQPSGDITALSSAVMSDDSMHVDVVAGGTLFDIFRTAGGTWQAPTTPPQPSGAITQLSSTGIGGTLHLDVVAGGTLLDDANTSGAWQSQGWASPGQPNGTITALAVQGISDGTMHVEVVANGTVYDDLRNADGTWQSGGFIPPVQPTSAPSGISDAGF